MSNPDYRDALLAMMEARKLADDRPDLAVQILDRMSVMDLALAQNDPAFYAARLRQCIEVLAAEPDEMAVLAAAVSKVVAAREAAAAAHDAVATCPAPGSPIPDQFGFVVGECEHRVAASEWRAGFRTCERCPNPKTDATEEAKPGEVFTDRHGQPWFLIERIDGPDVRGGLKLVNVNGNWDMFEGIEAAFGPLTRAYPVAKPIPARDISECAGFCVGVCTCAASYTAEAAVTRRSAGRPAQEHAS